MVWIAFGLFIGQGVIAVVLLKALKTFGVYAENLIATQRQNLLIRRNLAIQQNEYIIDVILKREKEA